MATRASEVSIMELDLLCNFDTGHHDTRNRRTCDHRAESIVYNPDAPKYEPQARCDEHEGKLDEHRRGAVKYSVPRDLIGAIESAPPFPGRRWTDPYDMGVGTPGP